MKFYAKPGNQNLFGRKVFWTAGSKNRIKYNGKQMYVRSTTKVMMLCKLCLKFKENKVYVRYHQTSP